MEPVVLYMDNIDFTFKKSLDKLCFKGKRMRFALQKHKRTGIVSILRKTRIQHRLFTIFIILSLIPVFGIGFYSYRICSESLNTRIGQSARQAIKLLSQNLLIEVSVFSSYANTVSVTDEIQNVLTNTYHDADFSGFGEEIKSREQLYDWAAHTLHTAIDTKLVNSKYLKNIQVADRDGRIIYDLLYGESQQSTAGMFEEINRTSPHDSLQYGGWARGHDTVVLGRRLHNLYGENEPIGYLLFYIDQRLFTDKLFPQVSFGPDSAIVLVSAENTSVISSGNPGLVGGRDFSVNLSGELLENLPKKGGSFNAESPRINGYLVVAEYIPGFDNYLAVLISNDYINADVNNLANRLIIAGFVFFLAILTLTMLIYYSIIYPIKKMTMFCEEFTADPEFLHSRINDTGADELRLLSDTVDSMLGDIQRLIKQQEEDERRKRELELERLHYQINPHFLFNTLDTLKWIADGHEVPVLTNGIAALSSLLRSTIMEKNEYISLKEELDILSSYIDIQKIRYADSFSVIFELDHELDEHMIPRFTFQPLLENAIMHGTYDTGEEIEILISTSRDGDNLVLSVSDNGRGFDADEKSNNDPSRFHGIGLRNVAERLSLHYGGRANLSVTSVAGRGTDCVITIPFSTVSLSAGSE